MLTPEALLNLAVELTDAAEADDAASLAAIAWRLYGEVGENLAEIGRLRAAIHAAWNRPQETAPRRRRPREQARWPKRRHRQQADAARQPNPAAAANRQTGHRSGRGRWDLLRGDRWGSLT